MIQTTASPVSERRSLRRLTAFAGLLVAVALLPMSSCRSAVPNRNPVGEAFPEVLGKALSGEVLTLPPGEPCVLLLGYVQNAQFDADRWLVGLLQAAPSVRIYEVPAVAGLFPSLLEGTIDSGMRSGIPEEDWNSVVTVYGKPAERIVALTGSERPRNIRVLLLDAEGRVRWFHDRGFSAGKLLELGEAAADLIGE